MINENDSINVPLKQKNQNSQITIGVLFGGRSAEHEISLRSALYVLKNTPQKYSIIPIGISREGEIYSLQGQFNAKDFANYSINDLVNIVSGKVPQSSLHIKNVKSIFYPVPQSTLAVKELSQSSFRNLNQEISCVFPVIHGTNGEDGRLQGLFELADIPCVGCDRVASVLAMDKDIQKRLARDAGIPIANYTTVSREEFEFNPTESFERIEKQIGYPCFVKPNALGSAVGAGKALDREQLKIKLSDALRLDSKAIIEELINGTEIECAFLGTTLNPRITTPGEISTEDFYSYDEKYSASSKAALFVPARLEKERTEQVKTMAKKIVSVLGLYGFARIDFWNTRRNDKPTFLFNEANTIPGLTSISMFPKLWEHDGISGETWIEELIESALARTQI